MPRETGTGVRNRRLLGLEALDLSRVQFDESSAHVQPELTGLGFMAVGVEAGPVGQQGVLARGRGSGDEKNEDKKDALKLVHLL